MGLFSPAPRTAAAPGPRPAGTPAHNFSVSPQRERGPRPPAELGESRHGGAGADRHRPGRCPPPPPPPPRAAPPRPRRAPSNFGRSFTPPSPPRQTCPRPEAAEVNSWSEAIENLFCSSSTPPSLLKTEIFISIWEEKVIASNAILRANETRFCRRVLCVWCWGDVLEMTSF